MEDVALVDFSFFLGELGSPHPDPRQALVRGKKCEKEEREEWVQISFGVVLGL